MVISDQIEAEYYDAASKKGIVALFARHGIGHAFYRLELDALCLISERVTPTGEAPPCRDEDDRKYLHCAAFANVGYLVTYDRDLLDLGSIGDIPIVTPANLLHSASAAGVPLIG